MLPPRLCKGDTIAIFSPSSPATATAKARYQRAKRFLSEQGYRIREGKLTGASDYYRSGNISVRAEELNELICAPEVRCVMAAIGGMNSNALLPYLDYDALKKDPKILVGYSDVTALLLGVYAKTGLTTYYGPAAVASFGEFPPLVEKTLAYFEGVVGGVWNPPCTLPTPGVWTEEFLDWNTQARAKRAVENQLVTVRGGRTRGKLIGGNLNTLQGIFGTPYMPEIRRGDLLFFEDSLKDAATVERSFSLLKLAGVFERIGGLILGKHEQFDDCGTGRRPYEILCEVMGEVGCPVLAEFDCCHTHPMLTLPIGCEAELDADAQTLTLTAPFVHK